MQNRCHIMKLLWPYKMDLKFTTKEPIYNCDFEYYNSYLSVHCGMRKQILRKLYIPTDRYI